MSVTSYLAKQRKTLVVFDLNGVLGYYTKEHNKYMSQGIYSVGDRKVKPQFTHANSALYERPNLDKIAFDLLVKQKKMYDVGVWSCANKEETQFLVEKFFGRFFRQ